MKKIQFMARISDSITGYCTVEAYPVATVEWAQTVAYRYFDEGWSVSEWNSGGSIVTRQPSMKAAVAAAVTILNQKGREVFEASVKQFMAETVPVVVKPASPIPLVEAKKPVIAPVKTQAVEQGPPANNWSTLPSAKPQQRIWPKVGDTVRLLYNKAKYPNMPFRFRKGKVLIVAHKRPMNVLVEIVGGKLLTVPIGNCKVENAA